MVMVGLGGRIGACWPTGIPRLDGNIYTLSSVACFCLVPEVRNYLAKSFVCIVRNQTYQEFHSSLFADKINRTRGPRTLLLCMTPAVSITLVNLHRCS